MKRVSKNPGINKNQKETLAEIQAWASGNTDQPRSMIEKIARLVPTSTQAVPKKSPGIWNIHQEYMGLSTKSHLFMTNAVYTTLLERRIQQVAPPIEDTPTITITEDTKQSLHYVGGYFIRSLTKTNNVKVRDFLQLLTDNKEDSTRHSEWTTLQNRGGLIFITNDFYDILYSMELVATNLLQKGLRARKIADLLSSAIENDTAVKHKWKQVARSLSTAHAASVFGMLVRRFSSLRCTVFAAKLDAKYCELKKATTCKRSAGLRAVLQNYGVNK